MRSEDVVQASIDQIRAVNPLLNAVVAERFEAALTTARMIDKVLDSGNIPENYSELNAPLLGLPFTAKEAFGIVGKI